LCINRGKNMKKIFMVTVILALVMAGCGKETPNVGGTETTLTITNLSDYNLLGVEYSAVDFGDINSGKDSTKEVSAETKYIFFFLQTTNGKIRCKFNEALTCNEGIKNKKVIINNDVITTSVTERTDTLKNIVNILNNEPANPKIKILYENYPVSPDSIIPLYDTSIGMNKTITLKIVNEGEHDLVITGTKPQISGANAAQVNAGTYSAVRIPYSETAEVGIQFTLTVNGNNSFAITIVSNDQVNGTYTIQVTAKVTKTWQKLYGASGKRYGINYAVSNGEGGMYAGGYIGNNTAALFNFDQYGELKNTFENTSGEGTIGTAGIGIGPARNDYYSVYEGYYDDQYYITKSPSPAISPNKIPTTSNPYNGQTVGMIPVGIVMDSSYYYFVAGYAYFFTSDNITQLGMVFINRHYSDGTREKGKVITLSTSGITANSYETRGMELLTNGDVLLYGKANKAGKDVAFACTVNVSAANADSWDVRWINTYEITNKASKFINHFVDNSSNVILLGYNDDGGFIVKFPMSATTAAAAKPTGWSKTINGNKAAFCGGLAINDNSGYLLVGEKQGTNGGLDVWVVKTDTNAVMSWETYFGGTGDESGMAVIEQTDGFIIAGSTLSPEIAGQTKKGTEDIYILKINKDGTMD
jgi:hypothetical protein